ncbi:glycosyltransferase [Candidatus Uhrbacteria bacterium]|nr:glycosyltransferase [Candidatus Uhrbacteria bacterium]
MKIAYLSNLYGSTARGGAERVVALEAEAMAAAGHDVMVASLSHAGAPLFESGAIRVYRYAAPNLYAYPDGHGRAWTTRMLWHAADTWNGPSARLCRSLLAHEKPDVVHTHNLMGLGFSIPTMIRGLGLRHVHTVHDVQLLHPSGLLAPDFEKRVGLGQRVYIDIMRRRLGSPETVVFPSRYLLELHDRFGFFSDSEKVVVPTPTPAVSLRARALPSRPAFLFAGQLEEHKGARFLLDAWSRWPGAASSSLTLIGSGSLSEEIAARAGRSANVEFAGAGDRDGVLAAMDRAAFTVVPSLVIENSPAVIAESFSRGTPVVAANVGGIPERVVENETGFLFEPGDAASFAAALDRAAASLPDWRKLFEHCCRAAAKSTPGAHIETLERIYKKSPIE